MKTKKCFKCNNIKPLNQFYKHPDMPDGRVNKCKECNKKDVRLNLANKKERYAEYDRDRIRNNFNYIFLHRYSGMLARVEGRNGKNRLNYKVHGKPISTKEEFISWCWEKENLIKFKKLHDQWRRSSYDRALCPSVDRIDEDGSYTIDNIQWLTLRQNIKKHHGKEF